jgi:two-component system CheB/CheR fusion protein
MVVPEFRKTSTVVERGPVSLVSLLEKVYREAGYDFRGYKRATVNRRLERRLHATGTWTYLEYMHFLETHPEEYRRLADELSIQTSDFFRSRGCFERLTGRVLPELIAGKEAGGQRKLVFWSAACARGEEPYSIAMLLGGYLGRRRWDYEISIYATDISRWALSQAQTGIYSPQDMEGLPDSVREEYFMENGDNYELRPDIHQMVKFSHFDLTSTTTPPFTGVDCIFCCNVLIYWQRPLQGQVLGMLYEALAAPGYLVLGEVETPTDNVRRKLTCLDSRTRIYKKEVKP